MLELLCHPDTPSFSAQSISACAELSGKGALWLRFHVTCDLDRLALPGPADPVRCDGLWQSTCFEVFLRRETDTAYLELNFAPSSQWAAYQFGAYRDQMADLSMPFAPEIGLDASDSHFALEVEVTLPSGWQVGPFELGLSAVIEDVSGAKSYWALAHPPGKPDFHHKDCFALKLPASGAA
jgi:hypothetical protein